MSRLGMAVLLALLADDARAAVVPNAQADTAGNAGNAFPFDCVGTLPPIPSMRYQQVYDGSEVGSGTISEIRFRRDEEFSAPFGPSIVPDVTITLSSTVAGPESLSTTFAMNVGADVVTVFSGDLSLSSAASDADPPPFDVTIPLSSGFSFDASPGLNLLLDVTVSTCVSTGYLDAHDERDGVARVFAPSADAATASMVSSSLGLVTEFVITPLPCGNGMLDSGEECDDGNVLHGDCCSATCQFEQNGARCVDDGDPCTIDRCTGSSTECGHSQFGAAGTAYDGGTGHCFYYHSTPEPWPSAEAACEAVGGTLAVIDGATENDLARSATSSEAGPWIGFHDMQEEAFTDAASFAKVTGGNLSYDGFAPGEPDDAGGNEDCVRYLADSPLWSDAPCSTLAPYVCERATSLCGDLTVEGIEQCDDGNVADGDCCSSTCRFESAATECRAAAGDCDLVEFCTGASQICPPDTVKPDGSPCTDDGNVCTTDACDGTAVACQHPPGNAGTTCRPAAGPCDEAETCSGLSPACFADGFKSANVVCRSSAGLCDVAESCPGSAAACPPDAFAPSSTVCRPSGGACDPAEHCTGTSVGCPGDSKSTAVCRVAAGQCDVAESCDGIGNACPPDVLRAEGTACDSAIDQCLAPDSCQAGVCVNDGGGGDPDGDGYCGVADGCQNVSDPRRGDTDRDGRIDACDNCIEAFNPMQSDGDGDRAGDLCDDEPVPMPLSVKTVRLKGNISKVATRPNGSIDVRATLDPTELGGDLSGLLTEGAAVEVRGAGLAVPETMDFPWQRCALEGRRFTCVGTRGEALAARRKATGLYPLKIAAKRRTLAPPLGSDAITITLSMSGLDRRDAVGDCARAANHAVTTCRK